MARKDAVKMLFYLRNNYSPHIEGWAFIEDIPQDDRFSFKEISDYLKTLSKSIREVKNISLKNKSVVGWLDINSSKCLDAIKICVEKFATINL